MLFNMVTVEYVYNNQVITQPLSDLVEELSNFPNIIKTLSMEFINGNDKVIANLCKILRENYTLTTLSLKNCLFKDDQIKLLTETLYISQVMEFNLINHNISLQGAKSLGNYIKNTNKLEKLSLASCSCKDGLKYIVEALKSNRTLKSLNIAKLLKNRGYNRLGLHVITNALIGNNSLKHLNISANSIHNADLEYFTNVLCLKTKLESLDLSRNPIGRSAIAYFTEKMKQNVYLKSLILNSLTSSLNTTVSLKIMEEKNFLGNECLKLIALMLKANKTLKHLSLSDNINISSLGMIHLGLAIAENSALNILELEHISVDNFDHIVFNTALEYNKNLMKIECGYHTNIELNNHLKSNFIQADKLALMLINKIKFNYKSVNQLLQRKSAVQFY